MLDQAVGVERVRVVDDETQLERHAVLAHLAANVLGRDGVGLRSAPRPGGGGADGRVERDVAIEASSDARPGVLAAAQRDERAVATADCPTLAAVGWHGTVEHGGDVHLELRDPRPPVELV